MQVTIVHTLSDVLDGFLLRIRGVSLWPCPGCANSRCASCAPPDRLLLDHLVPPRCSTLLPVTSHPSVSCVGILLRSHGLSIPPKGTTPEIVRSGSLRLMSSSTMACPMLSRHHSLCSLTSALICAVLQTSLESPPAGCTRGYASCAIRDTTLWLLFAVRPPTSHLSLSLLHCCAGVRTQASEFCEYSSSSEGSCERLTCGSDLFC